MKTCANHPDKKAKARGLCHSCYQSWRRKNTVKGKEANRRNKLLEVKRRKIKNRIWINDLKENSPCYDCKKYYPYWVMQFDHTEDNKSFHISGNLSRTINTLKEEINKCDLVCATCHAHRTYCRFINIEHYVLGNNYEKLHANKS